MPCRVKGSGWAALPLARAAQSPSSSRGVEGQLESALARQRNADLRMAFDMLQVRAWLVGWLGLSYHDVDDVLLWHVVFMACHVVYRYTVLLLGEWQSYIPVPQTSRLQATNKCFIFILQVLLLHWGEGERRQSVLVQFKDLDVEPSCEPDLHNDCSSLWHSAEHLVLCP